MAALAMDQGAAIETVLGAEQRQQIAAVALLDGTLDDDEQGVSRRILDDDCFPRTEVGDIQRRAQRLDLLRREPVKGWVRGIEGVGHRIPGQIWYAPRSPRPAYWLALRLSMRSSTTLGSARVEVSPRLPNSFSAILRRMRRMILPERVLGRPGANWITSGEAIGPISLRTWATSSFRIISDGVSPAIKV